MSMSAGSETQREVSWLAVVKSCARFWFAPRWRAWALALLIVAVAIVEVAIPLALGGAIGAVAKVGPDAATEAFYWLLGCGAALLCHAGMKLVFDLFWNQVSSSSICGLQAEAFSRVQRFSNAWHSDTFAGATVHRLSRARWAIDAIGVVIFGRLATPFLMIVVVGVLLTLRLPVAGLVFFIASAVYLTLTFHLAARWVRPANVIAARLEANLTGAIADAIANNSAVKAFGAEAREDRRLEEITGRWRVKSILAMNRASLMQTAQLGVWALLQTCVLATLVWFAGDGRVSVADLGFAVAAILQLGAQLRGIGGDIRMLQRAFGEYGETIDFLTAPYDVSDPPAPAPLPPPRGAITFDRVTFGYDKRGPLFDRLSLHIAPGEHVALVGATGSGKSSFVKLIQRLYDVDGGDILIDGTNICDVEQADLRRRIALVPQEPALFHRTLAENIAYGRPGAAMAEIVEAAKKARAHDFILASPNGYETLVGERGLKLSGGERQRVAIARAFMADAPIVVFDEATASLDTLTEKFIQEAMNDLMLGRTTVIIAHRLSTVRLADRILVFEGGRVVEEGPHAELINRRDGWYRKLTGADGGPFEQTAA